jgi:CarboxypepD_reg-like domain
MKMPLFRLLLVFFFIYFPSLLMGQVLLRGTVTDSLTKERIPFCSFIVKGTTQGAVADDQGNFSIQVDKLPVTLVFTAIGYKTFSLTVSSNKSVQVRLAPVSFSLKTVTISSDRVQTWHSGDAWNYVDYCFYDDYILSLVLITGKNKYYLVLTDTLGAAVASLRVKGNPEKLFTDCVGAVHLYSGDSVYQVYYDYVNLSLPFSSKKETFEKTMLPCRCQSGSYYYFSFSSYHQQKLDYYYINWFQKGKYQPFLSIHDSDKIVSFNENYDIRYFLEKRRKQECCLEPVDSIVKYMDDYRARLPLTDRELTWLTPVSSPIVKAQNHIYIFNPLDSFMLTYKDSGQCIARVRLSCAGLKGWQTDELYSDELTGKIYGRIVSNGITRLVCIDPFTGNENGFVEIAGYAFISRIRIRSATAYFLWKDPYTAEMSKLRMISLQ